jgi:uncharacterized protein YhfF
MTTKAEQYWQQFLASLAAGTPYPARYTDVFSFGTRPEHGRPIAALVLAGTKTATGSLRWTYEAAGKPLPQVGDLSIVTDGTDMPVCIIETVDVQVRPYDEVGEAYAWEGGERDRTLASWQDLDWDYIGSECGRLGRQPTVKTPLVMERFRVVYQAPFAAP